MKQNTKQTLKAIFFGIVVYLVEFVLIFGLVKLIIKIIDVIRARRHTKTNKTVENNVKIPENVELDTEPWVKTTSTTWENLKPYVEDWGHRCDVSIYGELKEKTIKEVVEKITNHYNSTRALVDIHYNGKDLDVWVVPSELKVYLDDDKELTIDESFWNMKVKATDKFIHVVVIEDAELDPKPYVETPKTTWENLKPHTFKTDDNFDASVFEVWEDSTMKDVIDNILHYYICNKALISVVYKGKVIDVWITPGMKIAYLDRDNKVRFKIDESFLNMKVKRTNENIHLALVED